MGELGPRSAPADNAAGMQQERAQEPSAARPAPRTRLLLAAIVVAAAALRLPLLGSVPPGLIPDEASTAYDAYSVLKTGRDQYGELLPLFPRSTERLNSLYL